MRCVPVVLGRETDGHGIEFRTGQIEFHGGIRNSQEPFKGICPDSKTVGKRNPMRIITPPHIQRIRSGAGHGRTQNSKCDA